MSSSASSSGEDEPLVEIVAKALWTRKYDNPGDFWERIPWDTSETCWDGLKEFSREDARAALHALREAGATLIYEPPGTITTYTDDDGAVHVSGWCDGCA